jgi:hypothetical protein
MGPPKSLGVLAEQQHTNEELPQQASTEPMASIAEVGVDLSFDAVAAAAVGVGDVRDVEDVEMSPMSPAASIAARIGVRPVINPRPTIHAQLPMFAPLLHSSAKMKADAPEMKKDDQPTLGIGVGIPSMGIVSTSSRLTKTAYDDDLSLKRKARSHRRSRAKGVSSGNGNEGCIRDIFDTYACEKTTTAEFADKRRMGGFLTIASLKQLLVKHGLGERSMDDLSRQQHTLRQKLRTTPSSSSSHEALPGWGDNDSFSDGVSDGASSAFARSLATKARIACHPLIPPHFPLDEEEGLANGLAHQVQLGAKSWQQGGEGEGGGGRGQEKGQVETARGISFEKFEEVYQVCKRCSDAKRKKSQSSAGGSRSGSRRPNSSSCLNNGFQRVFDDMVISTANFDACVDALGADGAGLWEKVGEAGAAWTTTAVAEDGGDVAANGVGAGLTKDGAAGGAQATSREDGEDSIAQWVVVRKIPPKYEGDIIRR